MNEDEVRRKARSRAQDLTDEERAALAAFPGPLVDAPAYLRTLDREGQRLWLRAWYQNEINTWAQEPLDT